MVCTVATVLYWPLNVLVTLDLSVAMDIINLLYWLLAVRLHVMQRGNNTVLAAGCVPACCAQGQQYQYLLLSMCLYGVHRANNTVLSADCVPAWCAQGQQYPIGCWLCAAWCAQGQQYCTGR